MNRGCAIDGCTGRHEAKGYCDHHYRKFTRYGDPLYVPKGPPPKSLCKIPNCGRLHHCHGYCSPHYARFRKYGDPLEHVAVRPKNGPLDNLPAAPLLAELTRRGITLPRKGDQKAIARANHTGTITVPVADRLCVELLGVHPAAVYGNDWWLPEEAA